MTLEELCLEINEINTKLSDLIKKKKELEGEFGKFAPAKIGWIVQRHKTRILVKQVGFQKEDYTNVFVFSGPIVRKDNERSKRSRGWVSFSIGVRSDGTVPEGFGFQIIKGDSDDQRRIL